MKKTITAAMILILLFVTACAPAAPEAPAPSAPAPAAPAASSPAPATLTLSPTPAPLTPASNPTPGNAYGIVFNEVDAVVSTGTPFFSPEAYSESPSADETKALIHIDIAACLPQGLEGFDIYYNSSYHSKDELTEVRVVMLEGPEHDDKTIEVLIANPAWSPNSIAHGSDYYKSPQDERSPVNGVAVDAYVWPAHVDTNPESGYYRELDAYYLAFFEIDGFKYYIEGREGITEQEFSEFIANVIAGYEE